MSILGAISALFWDPCCLQKSIKKSMQIQSIFGGDFDCIYPPRMEKIYEIVEWIWDPFLNDFWCPNVCQQAPKNHQKYYDFCKDFLDAFDFWSNFGSFVGAKIDPVSFAKSCKRSIEFCINFTLQNPPKKIPKTLPECIQNSLKNQWKNRRHF